MGGEAGLRDRVAGFVARYLSGDVDQAAGLEALRVAESLLDLEAGARVQSRHRNPTLALSRKGAGEGIQGRRFSTGESCHEPERSEHNHPSAWNAVECRYR